MTFVQKIFDFCRQNKIILFVILITVLGFFLRFGVGLNELASDEVAALRTSMQSFPFGIISALTTKNLHAPFYYFILHFWIKLFGTQVLSLRLLSVLFGTACIPLAYICTSRLCSKNAGILAALLVAISPFMIAYSNFAKFYSLLALLGFMSILFLIKVNENPKISNIFFLAFVNALIIYSYVLGFLFVLIQFVFFAFYLYFRGEKQKCFIFLTRYPLILLLLSLPIIKFMSVVILRTQNGLLPTFWWYSFRFDDVYCVLYSWFCPALPFFCLPGSRTEATQAYFTDNVLWFFVFNLIPVLIYIVSIFKALKKKNFIFVLFLISFLFILAEFIGAMSGKFAFCSRYTVLAFPMFIIAAACGLDSIKKKYVAYLLVAVLFFITILYENVKIERIYNTVPSGIEVTAENLKSYSPSKRDFVIMPFRGYYLEAYFNPGSTNFISFDINYAYKINDKNILKNILDEKYTLSGKIDLHKRFENYVRTDVPSNQLRTYLNEQCFKKLQDKGKVYIILANFKNHITLDDVIGNDSDYNFQSIFTLLLLKINTDVYKITSENLHLKAVKKSEMFDIYVFGK